MPILLSVAAIIALALLIGWLRDSAEHRRSARLRRQAEQLGYEFSEEGDDRIVTGPSRFLLFSQGVSGETHNVIRPEPTESEAATDEDGAPDLALFEYVFNVPFGRYYQTWRQTIARWSVPSFALPTFSVMPHAVFNALVSATRDKEKKERLLGSAGVRVNGHPEFTESHHVQAYDRAAVQPMITEEMIDFFESHPKLCLEGCEETAILYSFDTVVQAGDLSTFIKEAEEVYKLLQASQKASDEQASE